MKSRPSLKAMVSILCFIVDVFWIEQIVELVEDYKCYVMWLTDFEKNSLELWFGEGFLHT